MWKTGLHPRQLPTIAYTSPRLLRGIHMATRERKGAPLGLRIQPSLKLALENLAKADDRSLAAYVDRVLKDHVAAKEAESGKPASKRK